MCRGHRPIVDTCANEAIPQWGKHDLISHVYLLIFGIDMVINKCLVDFLWFSCWKSCCFEFAWNNHYHEIGTERARIPVKVCNLWWVSDKVPQGRGIDPVQLLSRRMYDSWTNACVCVCCRPRVRNSLPWTRYNPRCRLKICCFVAHDSWWESNGLFFWRGVLS